MHRAHVVQRRTGRGDGTRRHDRHGMLPKTIPMSALVGPKAMQRTAHPAGVPSMDPSPMRQSAGQLHWWVGIHQLRLKKCLGDFVLASFWRALVVWSPHLPPVFGFCFLALRSLPISAADLRPLLHSSPLHLSMSSITTKAGLVLPSPCKPTAEWGTFWRGRGSSRSDQRSATISEAC